MLNDEVAHFRNLQSCGSVHTCPVCGPKIRQARAAEIEVGLAAHTALGGGVVFVTVTTRHHAGQSLRRLLGLVSGAWRQVVGHGSRQWKLDRDHFGIVGTIRTLEVTYGDNGWHPHLHVLVLTDRPLVEHERAVLADRLWGRWHGYLEAAGEGTPDREHGLTLLAVTSPGDVARYMAKVYDSLHHEMTRADLKVGRSGRNPFRLLADVVRNGDGDELALWVEYEKAIKGKRFLSWSPGLKARLGVGQVDDQAIVEAEVGGELVCEIGATEFLKLRRHRGWWVRILEAAEAGGKWAVLDVLWQVPD